MEMHKLEGGELALRFYYFNSSMPSSSGLVPMISKFCSDEGSVWCQLNVLEHRLRGKAATDVKKACSVEPVTSTIPISVSALIASLALAYILPVGFTVRILLCLVSIFLTYRLLLLVI